MPTVLMACTHPYWSHLQVGSQHLARQFARHGWDVVYLSAPITPLHLPRLSSPEVRARFKSALTKFSSHENGRIRAHTPFSLLAPDGRPLLRNPAITLHWFRTVVPSLKRTLARLGIHKVHVLYIDNLSYHFLLDSMQHDKSVFRVMDMHEHFPGWQGRAKGLAQKIAQRSDLTVYSAHGLRSYVDSLDPQKTAFVPNGVDFDFFHSARNAYTSPHPLVDNIPKPIALYTGMIDSRLDWRLISHAASNLPNASFVLAGPKDSGFKGWTRPENVYFVGPVSHAELPQLMASATAGIIPFDVHNRMDLIQGIRPLKLLEYMAAGLPVVCARWPEVENMHSPAWLYAHKQEFVDLVHKALVSSSDPGIYTSFASRYDWSFIFYELIKLIR